MKRGKNSFSTALVAVDDEGSHSLKRSRRRRWFKKSEPFLYLLPAAFFIIVFTYYPFIKSFWQSFYLVDDFGLVGRFAGLENYKRLLSDPAFLRAILNTFVYALVTVPGSIAVGLVLALMARKRLRFAPVYESMYLVPMAMSLSVTAMIFQFVLNPTLGILNKTTGSSISWLSDERFAFVCILLVQIWMNIGFNFLFLLTALRGIPDDILESAELDGARGLRRLFRIILPLISPTVFFLVVTSLAKAMTSPGLVLILTQGGPNASTEVLVSYLYKAAIIDQNNNIGNAATMISFILCFVVILFSFLYEKKAVTYQ